MKTYEAAVDAVQHPADSTEGELHEFVSILNNDHLRLSIDQSRMHATIYRRRRCRRTKFRSTDRARLTRVTVSFC